jgi:3'-phosphoadenosine 5'-phosphosulfate sulfotransferase (PAPS reductase)/FAD synthetase
MHAEKIIVSVSGGKDSTAVCLHLFELGYTKDQFDRVFMDTGWEHKDTYKYLDELEKTIGKIIRIKADVKVRPEHKEYVDYFENKLGFESQFVRRVFLYTGFPRRNVKWCTKDLKVTPIKKYFDQLDYDFINAVGIRKEESPRRSKMTEWEYNDYFDCDVWRPIIDWTEQEVIDIHHRFGLTPNRLYLNGSNRVGCYPCINSRKKEIKRLPPERIALIKELEDVITKLRRERLGEDQEAATFFQSVVRGEIMNIEEMSQWSRTSYGGKQFEMFEKEPPTCIKWGMCDL